DVLHQVGVLVHGRFDPPPPGWWKSGDRPRCRRRPPGGLPSWPTGGDMKIGAIDVLPVLDGVGKEQAAQVLTRPGVLDAWACHADSLDEHGTLHLDLGGVLLRTERRGV